MSNCCIILSGSNRCTSVCSNKDRTICVGGHDCCSSANTYTYNISTSGSCSTGSSTNKDVIVSTLKSVSGCCTKNCITCSCAYGLTSVVSNCCIATVSICVCFKCFKSLITKCSVEISIDICLECFKTNCCVSSTSRKSGSGACTYKYCTICGSGQVSSCCTMSDYNCSVDVSCLVACLITN